MELPEHSSKKIHNKSKSTNNELPLQLQAQIKGLRTSAIIMVIISIISVYFIPWAVFYIYLATELKPKKLPSRRLVKGAAIATLPLCLGLIPILIDIEFWKMNKRLIEYEEKGPRAFISDKEFLVGEPKRKMHNRIAWIVLISIIAIFVVLIVVAMASSDSDTGTATTPTSTTTTPTSTITPAIQAAKDRMDSLTVQYEKCSSDLISRKATVDRYSQYSVDSYNASWQACEDVRLQQNAAVNDYNKLIGM